MNLTELQEALRAKQVELWVEGDLLRFRMPGESLDKPLLAALRRHKRALIEELKRDGADHDNASRYEPLSLGQQALYFLHSLSPSSAAYNVAASFRIASAVDVAVMRQCFQTLVSRHEALRTTFETVDGNPRCRIHSQREVDFRQIDASGWAASQLHETAQREHMRPFDLKDGPLLRVRLFTTADDDHVFLMTLHHIVFDAWSLWLLQEEFDALYRHQSQGETAVLASLTASYSDFVRWQTQLQHGQRGEQLWQYWRNRLEGDLVAPDLPLDYPRPERPGHEGASHKFRVPVHLSARLRELGKSLGATPFAVMLAMFKTLLYRYTGQQDLTVGTTTSGRSDSAFTRVVGYFVNTLPIRSKMADGATFADYLAHVKSRTLEAIEHQDYPFPLLVDRLNPRRDTGRLPICSVMFGLQKPQQFQNAARLFSETPAATDWGGLTIYPYDVPQQEGQFDLTLEIFDAKESYLGTLKYDTELFSAETAERMSRHFLRLAESIVQDPHRCLNEYEILPDEEIERIRSFRATDRVDAGVKLLAHRLFERQVQLAPDRIATSDDVRCLTYHELNQRANQLARWLQQRGIDPGTSVACQVARGTDTAIALLGILKAGATYVPLDPACPRERVVHMLRDSGVRLVLTDSRQQPLSGARCACEEELSEITCHDFDRLADVLSQFDGSDLKLDLGEQKPAYVIYTSGSTGRPKGVSVSHGAIARHVLSIRKVFGLVAKDRMLQFSNTTFDPSLEQMLVPWSVGASVFLRGDTLWSPEEFWQVVERERLTAINLPPAYFRHCTESLQMHPQAARSLRLVIVGGDVFPMEALPVWQSLGVRILNAYGPTEAVITATVHELSQQASERARVPIGRPKPGMAAYVLDRFGREVPIGVPGELYLAGSMLADGYLHQPEMNRERFRADPWSSAPNGRMYRTGDYVRWTHDGELEFLGRCDRQVKIHGYRVEIGEIETRLDGFPEVRESHVELRHDSYGDEFLVAWLGVAEHAELDIEQLRSLMRDQLPGYMVPRHFVTLERLPLNGSGKVDVRALPKPKMRRAASHKYVAPTSSIEKTLVEIWSRVLEVEQVGTHDNFFDLGGSSLSSLRIVAMLNETGLKLEGEHIRPELLFEYPTVAELAAYWESYCTPSTITG